MKNIILSAAVLAALAAVVAQAASAGLWPHFYRTTISGATPALLNGTWTLAISNTAFNVTKGGRVAVNGTVKIDGNRITFHDFSGPLACRGAQANGTYTWRLQGAALTLKANGDTCTGRRAILTHPFHRIS
jgi:hypothetical protein